MKTSISLTLKDFETLAYAMYDKRWQELPPDTHNTIALLLLTAATRDNNDISVTQYKA